MYFVLQSPCVSRADFKSTAHLQGRRAVRSVIHSRRGWQHQVLETLGRRETSCAR